MGSRTFIFRSGPFTVMVSALAEPAADQGPYQIDFYYAGDERLRPRFLCTAEEATALGALAEVAADLTGNYLRTGAGFEQWCRDYGLDPAQPDLANCPQQCLPEWAVGAPCRPHSLRLVPRG